MAKRFYILLLIGLAHTLAHGQLEITSFFPTTGPEGTRIEIHGTSFQETRTIRFGNVSALFRIVSDSTIFALVPMHAPSGPSPSSCVMIPVSLTKFGTKPAM